MVAVYEVFFCVARLKKNMSCPTGFFQEQGTTCVQVLQQKQPTCPADYKLDDGTCIKEGSIKCPIHTDVFNNEYEYPCCKQNFTCPGPPYGLLLAMANAKKGTLPPYKPEKNNAWCCWKALSSS